MISIKYKSINNPNPHKRCKIERLQLKPMISRNTKVNYMNPIESLEFSSYIVGKGIIFFTMLYTTLNWWNYKQIREDYERENKKDNKDNKK